MVKCMDMVSFLGLIVAGMKEALSWAKEKAPVVSLMEMTSNTEAVGRMGRSMGKVFLSIGSERNKMVSGMKVSLPKNLRP